jgi:hypothetical protein
VFPGDLRHMKSEFMAQQAVPQRIARDPRYTVRSGGGRVTPTSGSGFDQRLSAKALPQSGHAMEAQQQQGGINANDYFVAATANDLAVGSAVDLTPQPLGAHALG